MDYQEAKDTFIQAWGTFGSDWGINRTMAQVHALLLIAPEALSAQDIRDELNISMGNANMNIRALIDWGLIYKQLKAGERKEYFIAEKDMSEVFKKVIIQRKKKELEPMIKALDSIAGVEGKCEHSDQFCKTVKDLRLFSNKADSMLDRLVRSDSNWFTSVFFKMLK